MKTVALDEYIEANKKTFKENAKRNYQETVKAINAIKMPELKQLFLAWLEEI